MAIIGGPIIGQCLIGASLVNGKVLHSVLNLCNQERAMSLLTAYFL